jgi:hypothetical protein
MYFYNPADNLVLFHCIERTHIYSWMGPMVGPSKDGCGEVSAKKR